MNLLFNTFLWINSISFYAVIFILLSTILLINRGFSILKFFGLKQSINKHDNKISDATKDQENADLKEIIKNHVFSSQLSEIDLNKKCVINTINPHSYCVSKNDHLFHKALINSDILLPDGSGIVLASKILLRKNIKKIAGADIHAHLLAHANLKSKRVFYLGASQNTLDLITKRLQEEFPNVEVSSYSPPYKAEFSNEDSRAMIDAVNTFNPDILFVGMTAPKQEKWVEENKENLSSTVITSIGAVFDFYAGTVQRSSPFWINLGLEWLPRLLREPKRLWRRNFISTPLFLLSISKAKLKV